MKIEYEIGLNNSGRPCIDLPPDYVHNNEDKFFAIEIARYYLQSVASLMTPDKYDENTINRFVENIMFLGQIGDELAEILFKDMRQNAEIAMAMNEGEFNAHIYLKSIKERDALGMGWIYYENKVFKREIGLKVMVYIEGEKTTGMFEVGGIYELQGGIENENWVKITDL
jgi:hypothetical protein